MSHQRSTTPLESRSGAAVHLVDTIDGRTAYLKATPATLGPQAIAAARRELRFYRDLAPLAPVRTPRLLDGLDTEDGVAVLLQAAGDTVDAPQWTERMWSTLGAELAGLHDMPLPPGGRWARPDPLRAALADPDTDRITAFWDPTLRQLAAFLERRVELDEQLDALPPVLVHGDCHPGNLLHSAGSLVFCDWQATGIGRPTSDLAFPSVRTTPGGTVVPPVLVDAYLAHRQVDRHALERALLAEELAILVFLWPSFATLNSPAGIARVRRRALVLAERWQRPTYG